MDRVFQARFYDGSSSRPHTAEVVFSSAGIQIIYTPDINRQSKVFWEKKDIHRQYDSSALLTLQYKNNLQSQLLEITDPSAIQEYNRYYSVSFYQRSIRRSGLLWLSAIVGAFVAIILSAYFLLLPRLADWGARQLPRDYEIELGKELYEGVLENEKVDSLKTKKINAFFRMMKDKPDYPVNIAVVKKDVSNAFALPGGGMVVYTRIIDSMQDYHELAALLAHEYSHVELRHATRNIFRSLSGRLVLSVFLGDMGGLGAVLLENADYLRNLSYSRELESEADLNGLMILKENALDSKGMLRLFNQLESVEKMEVNEMFSTHPDMEKRKDQVLKFIGEHPYQVEGNLRMQELFEQMQSGKADWD